MAKTSPSAGLAGGVLTGVLAVTPAACALAGELMPGGGVALERLVVAFAELLFLCAMFLAPRLALSRMMDWHPAAVWLVLAWFMLTACAILNAGLPAVAVIRQAEWVLHGLFAAFASLYLTAHPGWRRAVLPAAGFGLAWALGPHLAAWAPPWTEWSTAWGLLVKSPLVGIGPDQYAYLRPGLDHPGNAWLQLALEWGAPGFVAFLIAVAWSVRRGLTRDGEGGMPRFAGPGLLCGLMAAGLVSGALYFPVTLLFFAFTIGLCLRLKPAIRENPGFDRDSHGLALLSAVVLLAHALTVKSLVLDPAPPVGSLAAHLARQVPMAMAWDDAGEHMNRWAADWRVADRRAAYDLLDWAVAHSRNPVASLELMGQWFREDGFESEARHVLGQAAAMVEEIR